MAPLFIMSNITNNVDVTIILDKSGSMHSCYQSTCDSFNEFLVSQRKVEGEARLSLVQFDDTYEVTYENMNLHAAPKLSSDNYKLGGLTALRDAVGKTIVNTEKRLRNLPYKPDKIIIVIITDGAENASKEFSADAIRNLISNKENKDEWKFVFLGANQDAVTTGVSYGFKASTSATYNSTQSGMRAMMCSVSDKLASYRTSAKGTAQDSFGFTDEERSAMSSS